MVNTKAIHTGPSRAEILLIEEVSEWTRLPVSTLKFHRHRGHGGPKSFTLGNRRIAYKRADVEQWIEEQYDTPQGVA